jgi:hypothetical protein
MQQEVAQASAKRIVMIQMNDLIVAAVRPKLSLCAAPKAHTCRPQG